TCTTCRVPAGRAVAQPTLASITHGLAVFRGTIRAFWVVVMSKKEKTTVLVVSGSADPTRAAAQWSQRFVRERDARDVEARGRPPISVVLALAYKEDAQFVISGLRCAADSPSAAIDDQLAALMRRAPCPLWTVQPWAGQAPVTFEVAVVGVDRSTEA